jgi:hypothetical protein
VAENWGGLEVHFFLLLVADGTLLQHVQNERYRMMRSHVTTDQKWMNRNKSEKFKPIFSETAVPFLTKFHRRVLRNVRI